jgi:hypothetical protein
MEPEHAGMYTSQTIDYGVILSGEVETPTRRRKNQAVEARRLLYPDGALHA